jgi:tetratricopeptide (TPR) repeat protein
VHENPRLESLRRRVESDPASIAFAALAEEYRRAGMFQEAIETCKAGLQRHPSYVSAHVTLGRALLEVGQFEEAREELEHVLRVAPENLAAIRGLAEIHHRRGDVAETAYQAEAIEAAEPVVGPTEPIVPIVPVVPETPPALARLEAFLGAITRARQSVATSSPRS